MINLAPRYVDNIAEVVLQNCDIVSVISKYVPVKKAGRNHKALCPFHNEKTPSFVISEEKQLFHCFGCGAGGSAIQFVMMAEKLEFIEAVELLAEQNGLDLSRYVLKQGNEEENRRVNQMREAVREAANFYYKTLRKEPLALEYLKTRGLDEEISKEFGLGYAPDQWDTLYRYLLSRGYQAPLLEKAGLIVPRNNGSGYYDRFRNRLMFPIQDSRGKVIGFGGRVLDDSLPKYLNSPESSIFDKSRTLYGFHTARKHMEKQLILVEGYMDVVSLHQQGFRNVVATLGTAFTEHHAQILKRVTEDVILSYDSDSAGVKATQRALEILSSAGLHPRVLNLGGAKDPDDFIRQEGPEAFKQALEEAIAGTRFLIDQIEKKYNLSSGTDQLKFLQEATQMLHKLDNPVERESYIQYLSSKTRNSVEAIDALMRKGEESNLGHALRDLGDLKPMERAETDITTLEAKALETAAQGRGIFLALRRSVRDEWFTSQSAREIWRALERYYHKDSEFRFDAFLDELDIETLSGFSEILQKIIPVEEAEREVRTLAERMYSAYLSIMISDYEERVKNVNKTLEKSDRESIIKRLYELKKELSDLKRKGLGRIMDERREVIE